MKTLTWNEFIENVQSWAAERGIYEHSTPEAQLLKTLSEAGELADAKIKGDIAGMMDAIGDVAVCVVNYARMANIDITDGSFIDVVRDVGVTTKNQDEAIGIMPLSIGMLLCPCQADEDAVVYVYMILVSLATIAHLHQWDFMECCTAAWNEIKNRKGRMVAGGAFVKDEQ